MSRRAGPSIGTHAGFLESYKAITAKLKKRFLRKTPNASVAAEQYLALGKELENAGETPYAAFCCAAAARCEQALSNPAASADTFAEAAQLFVKAETDAAQLDFGGFEENLTEAIECYQHAITTYQRMQRNSLAATLRIELGHALAAFGRLDEAATHFKSAAKLLIESPSPATSALHSAAECLIRLRDFEGALNRIMDILDVVRGQLTPQRVSRGSGAVRRDHFADLRSQCTSGAYRDLIIGCETTALLLLLLVPKRLQAEHPLGPVLVRYRGQVTDETSHLADDQFLSLQTVVLAAEAQDVGTLRGVQGELWFMLSPLQSELLQLLLAAVSI